MPVVSISPASALEGSALIYTVTLDEAAVDAVTLNYRSYAGTAADTDLFYGLNSSRTANVLTFAPGETAKTISISSRSDSLDERDEAVTLRLFGLSENASFEGGEDTLTASGVIRDNDGTGSDLSLLVSDPILVEGDTGVTEALFELRLTRPADSAFTVSYRTRDISAVAGEDYVAAVGSVRFGTGDEIKTVSVPVYGDRQAEITESFALVVDPPSGIGLGTDGLAGEAHIRDDDTFPQPVVSIEAAEATEGQTLIYTVTLSQPTFDAVTLSWRMLEGTGDDTDLFYSLNSNRTSGTLTFAQGETTKVIGVSSRSDRIDERDESMVLELSELSQNASFAGGEDKLFATGVIHDNDGAGSDLALFVSDVEMIEGDSGSKAAVFELRLSEPASSTITVSYRTRDISAEAGEDYVDTIGSVSFAAGEEVKTVSVPVLGDTVAEATERFALVVDAPGNVSIAGNGLVGEALIRDDDTAPQPVVSLSPAAATEGQVLIYNVTLSEPVEDEVSMVFRMQEATGNSADIFYGLTSNRTTGVLTFAPGETSKTVGIASRSDSSDERDENLVLELFNLTENASFAGGEDVLSAPGVIRDNDGAGINLALFVSEVELVEGDGGTKEAVFELRLSQPAQEAILINYTTADLTAKAGEDYAGTAGSVSFAVGEEVKTVAIPVFGDTAAEFSERFALRVDASSVPFLTVADTEAVALIRDDDTTPGPVITVESATAREGTPLIFKVSLSEASADAVTVDYSPRAGTADASDIFYGFTSNRTNGTLTFEPGQTVKTVAIAGRSDSADERDETLFLEFSNAVNGVLADGAPSISAPGTILDDDGVGLNRSAHIEPAILREHGVASFVYEIPIVLSSPAGDRLDFTVSAIDQTAVAGLDYRLLDSRIAYETGQSIATVSVAVLGDSRTEGTESFTLAVDPVPGTPYAGSVADQVIFIRPGPLLPSPQDDVLQGTAGDDSINLLAGDDLYRGLDGDDTAIGGSGDDTLIGGPGADSLNGQAGDDLLIGGDVRDVSVEVGSQVYRLYQATLDRAPDTGGYDSWRGQIESGATPLIDVVTGFVRSREFQNTYGSLDDEAFVTLLYNNVLDRDPDAPGLGGWIARLDSGTSREQVVLGFSQSAEFASKTNAEAFAYVEGGLSSPYADDVYRLYQTTLDRAPDFGGLELWSGRLGDGLDFLSVVAGFVNSAEFQNTYGALDNREFITLLYNNVLNRDPDTAGLEGWTARLGGELTREEVVRGFSQSREFINDTTPTFMAYMKATDGDTFRGGPDDDLIYGGLRADTFVFAASDDGRDRVLQLDPWDTVRFAGFGYDEAGDAVAQMREVGSDVIFSDEGVSVIFMRTDLATMDDVTILV